KVNWLPGYGKIELLIFRASFRFGGVLSLEKGGIPVSRRRGRERTAVPVARVPWGIVQDELPMIRQLCRATPWKGIVPAVLVLAVLPASLRADWVGYQNDTKAVIIVQAEVVAGRAVGRSKPNMLQSGEVAWDPILVRGNRYIAIYDANKRLVTRELI